MTKIFTSIEDPEIVSLLKNGAVGVIPTDTVYGIVAIANSEAAITELYSIKGREFAPGTMIGSSVSQFTELGIDQTLLPRISHIWPAPLSVILDAQNTKPYLRQKRTGLPVRIPDVIELRKLLDQTGSLMTTSANAPTEPTATSLQMAIDYFGDSLDFYVDGGDLSDRPPSTIVGFSETGELTVYREGAIKITPDMLSDLQQED